MERKIAVKWLTTARDLKRRKARERNGLFVAEGVRTVEELARSTLVVEAALVAARAASDERAGAAVRALAARGVAVLEVTDAEFDSAADTEHPQGLLAIARQPQRTLGALTLGAQTRLLVLDAIQDPGNVGVLIRTAAALGSTAVVALPGTVDVWNAKVVRSAAGTHFRFPAVEATVAALQDYLGQHGVALWGTDASGSPIDELQAPDRLAIAVGNEGAGLSDALRAGCSAVVSLPMSPDVESYNVAVAAGITLYALRP
ncbi:MAG: RNA methyltransferase [Gemmatimonadaceae bacterium]|nr:RNA methyltransferase [Gemmatimonadaceae bacterium]